ncbi:hypothetical protein, partial [Vibrio parahaemolyticus]|uniref:hypothetical protein n=1 Tax=Vibrio parahaemolyticus TaxID=670 RepID=UPI00344D9A8E
CKPLIYKAFLNIGLDGGRQTCLSFDIEHTRQRDKYRSGFTESLRTRFNALAMPLHQVSD